MGFYFFNNVDIYFFVQVVEVVYCYNGDYCQCVWVDEDQLVQFFNGVVSLCDVWYIVNLCQYLVGEEICQCLRNFVKEGEVGVDCFF